MRNDRPCYVPQTPHRPGDLADRFAVAGHSLALDLGRCGGVIGDGFDSGQSREAWTLVLAVWSYPLFPLLMAIGAWVASAFRKNRLAAVLTGLTFVPPVLLYLLLWITSLF
jgi:hypothetical protein